MFLQARDADQNEYRFRYRLRDIGKFGFRTFFGFRNFFFRKFRYLYSLNMWNRKETIVSIYIYGLFASWPMSRSEMPGALNFRKNFLSLCSTAQLSCSLKR